VSELDHIVDSLFDAPFAPAPTLGHLERRRVQRRRRTMSARAVVAACALLAAFAIARPHASANTVHTINERTTTTNTVVPTSEGAAGTTPQVAESPATVDTGSGAPAVVPNATGSTTTTPGADGCALEANDDPVDVSTPVGGAGLGPYYKTCDYNAVSAGGFVAHGNDWTVDVYRGMTSVEYSGKNGSYPCRDVGTIQPGDHVVLQLRYGSEVVADPAYVRAGPDQHC
jgi:hypothetical protein